MFNRLLKHLGLKLVPLHGPDEVIDFNAVQEVCGAVSKPTTEAVEPIAPPVETVKKDLHRLTVRLQNKIIFEWKEYTEPDVAFTGFSAFLKSFHETDSELLVIEDKDEVFSFFRKHILYVVSYKPETVDCPVSVNE